MAKNIKLQSLLEGYAWERTPGKALPTLADVVAAHNAKKNLQEAPDMMTINDFNSIFETFYAELEENAQYMQDDTIITLHMAIKLLQKAQAQESAAHGVNFYRRSIKLKPYQALRKK